MPRTARPSIALGLSRSMCVGRGEHLASVEGTMVGARLLEPGQLNSAPQMLTGTARLSRRRAISAVLQPRRDGLVRPKAAASVTARAGRRATTSQVRRQAVDHQSLLIAARPVSL